MKKEGFSYTVNLDEAEHLFQTATYFRTTVTMPEQVEPMAIITTSVGSSAMDMSKQSHMIPGQMNEVELEEGKNE